MPRKIPPSNIRRLIAVISSAIMAYPAAALASSVALDATDNLLWVDGTGITKDAASTQLLSEITSSVTVVPDAVQTSLSGLSSAISTYTSTPTAANKTALQEAIVAYNQTVTTAEGSTATAGSSGGTLPTITFEDDVTLDGGSGPNQVLSLGSTVLSISLAAGKTLTITNSSAAPLTVSSGGFFAQTGDGSIAFMNNTASTRGGAIFNDAGIVTLGDGATFSSNSTSKNGGAINILNGTLMLGDDATFSGNSAGGADGGGAIFNNGGTVVLGAGANFSGNSAANNGGAINNYEGTVTLGDDATFSRNSASNNGGAILNTSGSTLTLGDDATFSRNSASNNGGAILNTSGSTLTLGAGTIFSGNSASNNGGAIYSGGSVTLQTSASGNAAQFYDNTASSSANSIYLNRGTLDITGDGVLDMLDPMSGSAGTVTQDGGTWYLGGATSFAGTTTFSINSGNLYLYGDGQSSLTNAQDSSGVIKATTGSITADSSGSSFTLGSGATLTAGGMNNAISMSNGTITLSNNAILAFNLAANDSSGDPMLSLTANSISVGANLTANLISDASPGTYTLLYGSQNGFLSGTTITLTAAGQAISNVDFFQGYTGYVDGNSYKVIAGNLSWYGNSVLSGSTTIQADGTFTLVNGGTFTISTVLADRGTGTYLDDWDGKSLTKAGAGTLILGAENTYTGATLVNAGTLKTGVANAIADTSGVTVASGATLNLGGNSQTIAQLNNSGTVLINDEGDSPLSSAVTVTGNMVNSGTLVLNNCSSCAGQTYIQNGNWVGEGGTVTLGTVLNGGDSETDKLIITGAATGTTYVKVSSEGGSGAQTLEGIEVVETGSSTVNAFVQSGRIVQGSSEYHLQQGTASGTDMNNWYLTSAYNGSSTYTRRPEEGIYASNLAEANTLFTTQLSDRQTGGWYIDPLTGKARQTSVWLRATGGRDHAIMSDGQTQFTTNRSVLQFGGDMLSKSFGGDDGLHVGAMAGYGYLSGHASNSLSGYGAKSEVSGYSAGLYGTWYQNEKSHTGLYVDSWVLYNVFNNTVKGDELASESYNSRGVTASLESGYTLPVFGFTGAGGAQNEVFVRPQAQVIWSGIKAKDRTESNGTLVQDEGSGNVQTRLGMRVSLKRQSAPNGKGISRTFEPFMEANWLYRSKQYGVSMDGTSSYIEGGRNTGELKLGVDGQIWNNFSLSANVGVRLGGNGYRNVVGSLKGKYSF
ncbi:autotransporter outer membrane beta-barrel domain-containing protein (plasmid) [Robbsia andropogonis]|uniref:autotransporter outer membrane beta-barrel domain-containing protein n=1 Tax=Robbsia andropogonis TaxID=28092 RepID=UPI003D1D6F35